MEFIAVSAPKVVNMVASCRVAEQFEVAEVALQLSAEYDKQTFPGIVYRIKEPKLAMLLFSSGKVVCTGGKNREAIQQGIEILVADLRSLGIETLDDQDIEVEVVTAKSQWLFAIGHVDNFYDKLRKPAPKVACMNSVPPTDVEHSQTGAAWRALFD